MVFFDRQKAARKREAIEQKYFPGHLWPADVYRRELERRNKPGLRVGHLGSGHDRTGIRPGLSRCLVIGLDLDWKSLKRLAPAPCAQANLETIPIQDNSLDLLVSEFVFEHFENPLLVLRECARILKPGGEIVFLTINRNSICGAMAAWTPHFFHVWINRLRPMDIDPGDVFPVFYRVNTRRAISTQMHKAGLEKVRLSFLEASFPYVEFSPFLYRLGAVFNRFLLDHESLRVIRTALLGVYRKPQNK